MSVLDDRHITLAESLKTAGYRTAAFVTNPHIVPGCKFDQGFDHFVATAGMSVLAHNLLILSREPG